MYKDKYLKYKSKYTNLKKMLNESIMTGGVGTDRKNILVMGGGPVGLVTALSLLLDKDENKIKANNIFLVERSRYWRLQVFFIQNSYTFNSIDYLREIDLETYKRLEKIGCYLGSPASQNYPYCYRQDGTTSISQAENLILSIKKLNEENKTSEDKLFLMNNLSFRIVDFENILFDRLLEINRTNINYYLEKIQTLEEKYGIDKIKFILESLQCLTKNECDRELVIALLIRDILKNKSDYEGKLPPLLITFDPFTKFINIDCYRMYKVLSNNIISEHGSNLKTVEEIIKLMKDEKVYLTKSMLNKAGIMPIGKTDWSITKEDWNLNLEVRREKTNLLSGNDYEMVFACDSQKSKFLDEEDKFFCIKNKDVINPLDPNNLVELEKNNFMLMIFKQGSVIKLNERLFIFTNVQDLDEEPIIKKVYILKELILKEGKSPDNLENYKPSEENYKMEFSLNKTNLLTWLESNKTNTELKENFRKFLNEPDIRDIVNGLKVIPSSVFPKKRYRNCYGLMIGDYNFKNTDDKICMLVKIIQLYLKNTLLENIVITNEGVQTTSTFTNISKVNTLVIEEKEYNEKEPNNEIINANIWFYEATPETNMLLENKFDTYNENINRIPLNVGYSEHENGQTLDIKEQVLKFILRTSKGVLPNQVYINNDQAQYYNNSMKYKYNPDTSGGEANWPIYKNPVVSDNAPQHIFRVFGVNTKPEENLENKELSDWFSIFKSKPYYYLGYSISSELKKLIKFIENIDEQNIHEKKINDIGLSDIKNKELLLKLINFHLYLLGLLFSFRNKKLNEFVNLVLSESPFEDFEQSYFTDGLLPIVLEEWNKSYGKKPVGKETEEDINQDLKNNPVNASLASVFEVILKYKEKTIKKDSDKTIFFIGDSNTTVNFFSGTGVNNGLRHLEHILKNYKLDESENTKINNDLMNSNRKVIYNSLLSTQNYSYISPKRIFNLTNEVGNNYGPFLTNFISKNIGNLDEINQYIDELIQKINLRYQEVINDPYSAPSKSKNGSILLYTYMRYYDLMFDKIIETLQIPVDEPLIPIIKYNIKYNLVNVLYSFFNINPVIGQNIGEGEEIGNYLKYILENQFDFCNFMKGPNPNSNINYKCDLIKDIINVTTYDSRYSIDIPLDYGFTT
jgi:hypothetical protein